MIHENTQQRLDREFGYLLEFGKTEIDLRYACGRFVTFKLEGHKVVTDGITRSPTIISIREYFQSKMETE